MTLVDRNIYQGSFNVEFHIDRLFPRLTHGKKLSKQNIER